MRTQYSKVGTSYFPQKAGSTDIRGQLPPGNYTVRVTPDGVFYLESIEPFSQPSKLYGRTAKLAERILHTFNSREKSTGAIFAGEKGSGKTLLARMVCLKALEQNIPTIVIDAPLCGPAFNEFVQNITQPAIFIFDEFEKVYNNERGSSQEALLTLFDGVYTTKKLFLVTTNNIYGLDVHMRDRPGRLFYLLTFNGLEKDFIQEYCEDNLRDIRQLPEVLELATMFRAFNFDMLQALVEEMNRYNEPAKEAVKLLNMAPETQTGYNLQLSFKGERVPKELLHPNMVQYDPLTMDEICVNVLARGENSSEVKRALEFEESTFASPDPNSSKKKGFHEVVFTQEHYRGWKDGGFVFINPKGWELKYTYKQSGQSYYYKGF